MTVEGDEHDYAHRAALELERAAASVTFAEKVMHLNMAARYATLRERSVAPHGLILAMP